VGILVTHLDISGSIGIATLSDNKTVESLTGNCPIYIFVKVNSEVNSGHNTFYVTAGLVVDWNGKWERHPADTPASSSSMAQQVSLSTQGDRQINRGTAILKNKLNSQKETEREKESRESTERERNRQRAGEREKVRECERERERERE
jgi:hypothetical protein